MDDDCEKMAKEAEKEHIDVRESCYAQLQVNEDLVNPTTVLVDDSEAIIGVVNAMMNPTINIFDVNFDEDLLTKDEWL